MIMVQSTIAFNTINRCMTDIGNRNYTPSYRGSLLSIFDTCARKRAPIDVGTWSSNRLMIHVQDALKVKYANIDETKSKLHITIEHPELGLQIASVYIPDPPAHECNILTRVEKNKIIVEQELSDTTFHYSSAFSLDTPNTAMSDKKTARIPNILRWLREQVHRFTYSQ